jgi:thioredoxin 1
MKEVLKFSASWCGPCKMLAMTVKELDDNTVPITDVDIDENLELATKYGIRGVPTLVLLENGLEVKRVSGALTLPKLKEFING